MPKQKPQKIRKTKTKSDDEAKLQDQLDILHQALYNSNVISTDTYNKLLKRSVK